MFRDALERRKAEIDAQISEIRGFAAPQAPL
jgi:hypothetical protein